MSIEMCHEHSGCLRDIDNLKSENKVQWDKLKELDIRMNGIMGKLNTILGGILVSVILILVDIVIRIPGILKN